MKKYFLCFLVSILVFSCTSKDVPESVEALITLKTFFSSSGKLPASASENDIKIFNAIKGDVTIEISEHEEVEPNKYKFKGTLTAKNIQKTQGIFSGLMMMGVDNIELVVASVDKKIAQAKNFKIKSKSGKFEGVYNKDGDKFKLVKLNNIKEEK